MGETTGIAWTDHTANFWIGCTRQSPGCVNCYAETMASNRMNLDVWGPRRERQPVKSVWANVRKWDAAARSDGVRRRVFCMSMGDFFEPRPEVAEIRARAWELIEECDSLDWQILTKHAASIEELLPESWGDGWPHVWLGVSVEDQQRADERIPLLLHVPAAVRFVSAEPLLGPVDLGLDSATCSCCPRWPSRWVNLRRSVRADWPFTFERGSRVARPGIQRARSNHHGALAIETPGGILGIKPDEFDALPALDWVIVGGESGPGHRPMDPAWAVSIRDQCAVAGVAFFFKQTSGPRPGMGAMPDGSTPREFPAVRGTRSSRSGVLDGR